MAKNGARDWYDEGVAEHYTANGASYRNPHEPIVVDCVARAFQEWPSIDTSHVLDLAAGSGELSRAVLLRRPMARLVGCDAFTCEAYRADAAAQCETLTFQSIAGGVLRGRRFSLIGCSFAMHLCERSLVPQLALELAQVAKQLLIITPHKRPAIHESWGWTLVGEIVEQRVRARFYTSNLTRA